MRISRHDLKKKIPDCIRTLGVPSWYWISCWYCYKKRFKTLFRFILQTFFTGPIGEVFIHHVLKKSNYRKFINRCTTAAFTSLPYLWRILFDVKSHTMIYGFSLGPKSPEWFLFGRDVSVLPHLFDLWGLWNVHMSSKAVGQIFTSFDYTSKKCCKIASNICRSIMSLDKHVYPHFCDSGSQTLSWTFTASETSKYCEN